MIPKTNPPLPLLIAAFACAAIFIYQGYQRMVLTDEILPTGLEWLSLLGAIVLTAICVQKWRNR